LLRAHPRTDAGKRNYAEGDYFGVHRFECFVFSLFCLVGGNRDFTGPRATGLCRSRTGFDLIAVSGGLSTPPKGGSFDTFAVWPRGHEFAQLPTFSRLIFLGLFIARIGKFQLPCSSRKPDLICTVILSVDLVHAKTAIRIKAVEHDHKNKPDTRYPNPN